MPTLGASLRVSYRGTYSASTTYTFNDVVYYNGTSYIALTTSTGQTPAAGTYWGLLAPSGAAGVSPVVSATAASLAAGASPTVTTTGTTAAPVFNFGIPAGAAGAAASMLTPVAKTAAYTAVAGDYVQANATSASFVITLPASATTGAIIAVRRNDTTSNLVTITATSGIDSAGLSYYLVGFGQSVELIWDGTIWTSVRPALAARIPPMPPLVKNLWYSNASGVTNTTAVSATGTVFIPYFMPRSATVGGMGIIVTTGLTGSAIRLGAFNIDPVTARPSTIIADFGLVSGITAGVVTSTTTSAVFPAGWIFLAFAVNPSGTTVYGTGGAPYSLGMTSLSPSVYTGYSSTSTSATFTASPTVSLTSVITPLVLINVTA
jgi:hypothetical protein